MINGHQWEILIGAFLHIKRPFSCIYMRKTSIKQRKCVILKEIFGYFFLYRIFFITFADKIEAMPSCDVVNCKLSIIHCKLLIIHYISYIAYGKDSNDHSSCGDGW